MVIGNQESLSSGKDMGDVTLTFKGDKKIPAHIIVLGSNSSIEEEGDTNEDTTNSGSYNETKELLPCNLYSKTFLNKKARDMHQKKNHNIDNIKYTPGPVNCKSWFLKNKWI